jgi:hypothetical protein
MERLSVRLTDRMFRELDALAAERGINRTRLVRQLLEAGLRDRDSIPPPDTPSDEELLELLAEKARIGNVAAIRTRVNGSGVRTARCRSTATCGRSGSHAHSRTAKRASSANGRINSRRRSSESPGWWPIAIAPQPRACRVGSVSSLSGSGLSHESRWPALATGHESANHMEQIATDMGALLEWAFYSSPTSAATRAAASSWIPGSTWLWCRA